MTRHLVLMVCLVLVLLLAACSRGSTAARVRLNSIRTVILRESHALPLNRSAREPSLDLTLYQCISDLECIEGSYCHAPTRGPAHPRCHTCRRRKRRCHRDGMCCPVNRCSNNICVPVEDGFVSQRIPDSGGGTSLSEQKGWRTRGRTASGKGQVGDPCLRSPDCSDRLCCARHFWTRICKPVLQEGQVCTRHRRKGNHGLELFQRCPCGGGLGCRTLRERSAPSLSSSSSSSSLLAAAAKSKMAASPSRHSSPNTSPLSSSSPKSSPSKARLHVCQKH